jgi:MFS family permease
MSRDLILVAVALVTWGVGEGMFLLFQPLYLQELGADPLAIGGIMSVIGASMAIAHLPAGYLADRIGRRPMLWMAWGMGLGSTWIMALSRSLPLFVVGSALYGLTSFVIVPLNSYITAARGNWSVGRALTLISAIYNVGAILGPILGGWVGEQAGLRANFLVAAIFFMLSCAVIAFIRPQPLDLPQREDSQRGKSGLVNARYLRYLVVVFVVMFSLYLAQPLSQNFLQNERGVNLVQIGQLISARSVGIVLLNLSLGQLNARLGFVLAQGAMALCATLLWQGSSMPYYTLAYVLMGSYQTARSLAAAQGRALVQAANMGVAYGMIETTGALAVILAPLLSGYLYSLNPAWIYSVSVICIALALVVSLLLSPVKRSDLAIEVKS